MNYKYNINVNTLVSTLENYFHLMRFIEIVTTPEAFPYSFVLGGRR
jgi:hypothetical protein